MSKSRKPRVANAIDDFLRRKVPVRRKCTSAPKKTKTPQYRKIRRQVEFIVDNAHSMSRKELSGEYNWLRTKARSFFTRRHNRIYRFGQMDREVLRRCCFGRPEVK